LPAPVTITGATAIRANAGHIDSAFLLPKWGRCLAKSSTSWQLKRQRADDPLRGQLNTMQQLT
jgi:hypothetical protein